MSDQIILQVIMTIAIYCSPSKKNACFDKIFMCSIETREASVIPTRVYNCIVEDVLKRKTK